MKKFICMGIIALMAVLVVAPTYTAAEVARTPGCRGDNTSVDLFR